MTDWKITIAEIESYYQTLNQIGALGDSPEKGYLRAGYSDEETAAMKFIETRAIELGAVPRWDAVKNLFLDWPGTSSGFVEFGSHLDTVPSGGNFDGAAGVVAGLAAIAKILSNVPARRNGLRLRVWRAEESATYNTVYAGSRSAFGKFNAKTLSNKFRGQTLEAAMRSQGADPEVARRGSATILQAELDSILSHVELHIEQGNVLEVQKKDVGIVTSIRGPMRHKITLTGAFDHSGATPMGVEYRRDCNLALAHMLVRLDELAKTQLGKGQDLVQTIGVINSSREVNENNPLVYENAVPKVSGYAYFWLDTRSNKEKCLKDYNELAKQLIAQVANDFRVTADIEFTGFSEPLEHTDEKIQERNERAATELGLPSLRLPSGAGHDAAIVGAERKSDGTSIPVGMVFIPCREGKSHCPEEYTSYEAIAKGASVLARGAAELI